MHNSEIIELINNAWSWNGVFAAQIIQINEFGNIIFKSNNDDYWRIYPEELLIEKIANYKSEFETLKNTQDFKEDWEMKNLVKVAEKKLGKLEEGESYYFVIPAVIGGKYDKSNIQKIKSEELISLSGDLAFQIKDLKDGQKIRINIKKND